LSPQGKLSALYAYLKERQIRDLPDREQQIDSVGLTWRPFTVPGRVSLDDPPSLLGQEVFSMADHGRLCDALTTTIGRAVRF